METKPTTYTTLDQMAPASNPLPLICTKCGTRGVYDVGGIFFDPEQLAKSLEKSCNFSAYFRCRTCNSAGPWDFADPFRLLGLAAQVTGGGTAAGVYVGIMALFDGTRLQTPAMGEEYLLNLIQASPANGFLCTRLGNLLRGCGMLPEASSWYEKAVTLDPGDIEALHHLFSFAVEGNDAQAALPRALALIRALLQGRTTNKEELTRGIAYSVVDNVLGAPTEFIDYFLERPLEVFVLKEEIFVRNLLSEPGDEDDIADRAVESLLQGRTNFTRKNEAMNPNAPTPESPIDLAPSLAQLVDREGLTKTNLSVALIASNQGRIRVDDRHAIHVWDGAKHAVWTVATLSELFRGNQAPPADLKYYPPEYVPHFFFIENHLLTACRALRSDPTDQEMEEVFANLRRRPDSRSLGPLHDFVWQVAALWLGRCVISQAQYEAVFDQLVSSTRKFALRPVSRNYTAYLHNSFEK